MLFLINGHFTTFIAYGQDGKFEIRKPDTRPILSNSRYIRLMLALFGAAALGILLFFFVSRFDAIQKACGKLLNVLTPFIIGAVLAYILKPSCNFIEGKLTALSGKSKKDRSTLVPTEQKD